MINLSGVRGWRGSNGHCGRSRTDEIQGIKIKERNSERINNLFNLFLCFCSRSCFSSFFRCLSCEFSKIFIIIIIYWQSNVYQFSQMHTHIHTHTSLLSGHISIWEWMPGITGKWGKIRWKWKSNWYSPPCLWRKNLQHKNLVSSFEFPTINLPQPLVVSVSKPNENENGNALKCVIISLYFLIN